MLDAGPVDADLLGQLALARPASYVSPAATTPPTAMSHHPGQMSLSSLRRWISSRPSVDITAMHDGPVPQPRGAHLRRGTVRDHVVVVVDDVDQFRRPSAAGATIRP